VCHVTGSSQGSESYGDVLARAVLSLGANGHSHAIVVDCSASEHTAQALIDALQLQHKVVCVNKKPLCLDFSIFQFMVGSPRNLHRFRYESTVAAGVPVIAAVTRMMAANDKISKVCGTLSGTLGYVMTGLQDGKTFSQVVNEAHQLGFTEPDPRDDLSGLDVARKTLILARSIMQLPLSLDEVALTPLYPKEWDSLSVKEFMEKLPELDTEMAERVAKAKQEGCVLRYVGKVESNGSVSVGLQAVSSDSALGGVRGCDNLIELYSTCYPANPLVLKGAGAGTLTTAAGALSDIVDLAFARQ